MGVISAPGGDFTQNQPEGYPSKEAEESLLRVLNVSELWSELEMQVKDCMTEILASIQEVASLRELTDVISEHSLMQTNQSMMANTKKLNDLMRSNERSSNALDVMQLI